MNRGSNPRGAASRDGFGGDVPEWPGSGLQNRVHGFDSRRRLHILSTNPASRGRLRSFRYPRRYQRECNRGRKRRPARVRSGAHDGSPEKEDTRAGIVPEARPPTRAGIDADHQTNLRLQLHAEDVQFDEFNIRVVTWDDTLIYGIRVNWIAYEPGK